MPTPTSSQPAGVHPARRQLDELDALLQQMLCLPVNRPPEAEHAAADSTVAQGASTLQATATDAAAFAGYRTADFVPMTAPAAIPEESTLPREPEPAPLPPVESQVTIDELPREVYAFTASEAPARLAVEPPPDFRPSIPRPLPQPEPVETPAVLWPLVAVNAIFDLFTYPLGRPGRWLRSPSGRTFLGLSGLALLVAAGVCVALGWSRWSW